MINLKRTNSNVTAIESQSNVTRDLGEPIKIYQKLRLGPLNGIYLVTHHFHASKFSYRFSGSVYQTLYERYTGLIDQARV